MIRIKFHKFLLFNSKQYYITSAFIPPSTCCLAWNRWISSATPQYSSPSAFSCALLSVSNALKRCSSSHYPFSSLSPPSSSTTTDIPDFSSRLVTYSYENASGSTSRRLLCFCSNLCCRTSPSQYLRWKECFFRLLGFAYPFALGRSIYFFPFQYIFWDICRLPNPLHISLSEFPSSLWRTNIYSSFCAGSILCLKWNELPSFRVWHSWREQSPTFDLTPYC